MVFWGILTYDSNYLWNEIEETLYYLLWFEFICESSSARRNKDSLWYHQVFSLTIGITFRSDWNKEMLLYRHVFSPTIRIKFQWRKKKDYIIFDDSYLYFNQPRQRETKIRYGIFRYSQGRCELPSNKTEMRIRYVIFRHSHLRLELPSDIREMRIC